MVKIWYDTLLIKVPIQFPNGYWHLRYINTFPGALLAEHPFPPLPTHVCVNKFVMNFMIASVAFYFLREVHLSISVTVQLLHVER